jgi:hypothetical protein
MSVFREIFEQKLNDTSADNGRKIFVDSFFGAFVVHFPGEKPFAFALDALMILLRRGADRWRFALLSFINSLLSYPSYFQLLNFNKIVS